MSGIIWESATSIRKKGGMLYSEFGLFLMYRALMMHRVNLIANYCHFETINIF